jgi:hypothetical protein
MHSRSRIRIPAYQLRAIVAVAALAATMLLAGAGSASAGVPASRAVISRPMVIVGVDAAVAKQHGYELAGRPDNTVGGSCGTSYVYLNGSYRRFDFTTGFTINSDRAPAVEYYWHVHVTGPSYSHTFPYGGNLALRHSWHSSGSASVGRSGNYTASVNSADSFAILANGSVCHSAGPASWDYVS